MKTVPIDIPRIGDVLFIDEHIVGKVLDFDNDGNQTFEVYNGRWTGILDHANRTLTPTEDGVGHPPYDIKIVEKVVDVDSDDMVQWYIFDTTGIYDEPENEEDLIPF